MYTDDEDGFKKEITAAYKNLFPIFGADLDCMGSQNELFLAMQVAGYNDKLNEMKYFKSFNVRKDIPVVDLIDAWVEFHTGTNQDAESEAIEASFDRPNTTST